MFADSLLETSWAQRTRRSWITLTSFGLQVVAVGVLLMIPLLTTVGLPLARTVSTPISMGRPDPGPAPQVRGVRSTGVQIVPYSSRIMAPARMPTTMPIGDDPAPQPPGGGDGRIGVGGPPNGLENGFPFALGENRPVIPVAPPPTPSVRAFRTSTILEGSLIRRVQPVYPALARNARIQGPVILAAVISKAGTIQDLRLVSGHPMLVPAAIDAVSQWRYRPYILNGDVIEVETRIQVNFVLGGN